MITQTSLLRGQGVWSTPFDHKPIGAEVHPASDSISNPAHWITENTYPIVTPGQRFSTVHTCLIPSGPFRGCILVFDGNLTLVGTRAYQPWSIVDPYWPLPNPFAASGGTGYRFHNGLLQMPPGQGELFCAGQRWVSDGRLFVAGGTRVYPLATLPGTTPVLPPVNTGMAGMWEGARLVYQWDPTTSVAHPFGRWYPMPPLEVERWYPTVAVDGTAADRMLILGGSDFDGIGAMPIVNTYESFRVAAAVAPPAIAAIEQKTGIPMPPPSARQYKGPAVNVTIPPPVTLDGFTEYPRIHALGVLDPISGGQSAPRQFVSGYLGQGIRWAHDPSVNPAYSLDVGQEYVDSYLTYSTNVLLPAAIGAIGTRVVRIGGLRGTSGGGSGPTNRVESVVAGAGPDFWSSGSDADIPDMIHARFFGNVVMLPTGALFAVGGTNGASNVLEPELLQEGASAWRPQATHASPRDYHACAVLLPDGRVMVSGGENRTSDYQIWSPQYLQVPATRRPQGVALDDAVSGLPVDPDQFGGVTYNQECLAHWTNSLPAGVTVAQAVLMPPAALTHHDDGGQRLIRLLMYVDADGQTRVRMPTTIRHAAPGWYMLFLVTNEGVPSIAFWINLR